MRGLLHLPLSLVIAASPEPLPHMRTGEGRGPTQLSLEPYRCFLLVCGMTVLDGIPASHKTKTCVKNEAELLVTLEMDVPAGSWPQPMSRALL